jgi:hypothetical protein
MGEPKQNPNDKVALDTKRMRNDECVIGHSNNLKKVTAFIRLIVLSYIRETDQQHLNPLKG